MLNHPWFYLLVAALSLSLVLSFNIYLFRPEASWSVILTGGVSSFLLTCVLLLLFVHSKIAAIFLTLLVIPPTFLAWHIHARMGMDIHFQMIASILETTWKETDDYVTLQNMALLFCLLLLLAARLFWPGKKLCIGRGEDKISWTILLWISLAFLLSIFPAKYMINAHGLRRTPCKNAMSWPYVDARLAYNMIRDYYQSDIRRYASFLQLPSPASFPSSCALSDQDTLTIILHLGESLRGDRLSINGYARSTTPSLEKERNHLVSFAKNYSYGTITRMSVIGMLTNAEVKNRQPTLRPFIDLFLQHGFDTTAVMMEVPTNDFNYALGILASCCQHVYFPEDKVGNYRFESTVANLRDVMKKSVKRRQFYLVYDSGAHMMFHSLPAIKRFLPDEIDVSSPLKDRQALQNRYDNNVLEIDREMKEMFEPLSQTPAVYIYAADHGVALGEDGRFGQGNTSAPVINPAFFIWMSPPFIAQYPEVYANLKSNEHKTVSHDYLYHTILSLGRIHSDVQKEELDLTNPEAEEFIPPEDKTIFLNDI